MNKNAKKQVIAYLHTHWDREWYRTKEEFNLRLLEVFDEILKELENGSMPCFYFDGQTAALEDYLKFRPKKINEIKELIAQKRLFIGPFYVSPDNFLINGISLIRNLTLGMEYSKTLGEQDFLGYLSDTFGHSKSIFEILKSLNISHSFMWRGVGKLKSNDFTINGMKATKLAMGYFTDILHTNLPVEKKAEILENIIDRIAECSSGAVLLPIGADHLAGLLNSIEVVNKINKLLKKYEITLSSPFEYAKKADCTGLSLTGEFLDNSETYILPGVYSSRIPQKVENARLQWDLFRIVEPFNFIMGGKYTPSLDYAVKELIKNHAHDSIYGCSTDEVHKCVQSRFDKVSEIVNGVKHRLIRDFKRQNKIPTDDNRLLEEKKSKKINNNTQSVGIFNFSNFNYSGTVRIITDHKAQNTQPVQLVRKFKGFSDDILYDIRQIPVTEQYLPVYEYLIEVKDLPAMSFSALETSKLSNTLKITDTKIANSRLELNIRRKNGEFQVEILDKKTNEKFDNALEILVTKDFGDSYNSAPDKKSLKLKLLGTKVVSNGAVEACLRLIYEKNFKLDVSLSNFAEFFKFRAKINNNKKNQKFQACLNLKKPVTSTIAEDAFGFIERIHDPDWLLADNMPAIPRIEVKTNSYPLQRWVLAQGLGVITKGLNDYEVYKNHLKITLLRGTGRISEPRNPARFVPAGPPIETPDLQCLGNWEFEFAIAPNSNTTSIYKNAEIFYEPVIGFLGKFKNFDVSKKLPARQNLLFYGLKPNGNKVFGVFYNNSDKNIEFKNKTIPPKTIEYIEL